MRRHIFHIAFLLLCSFSSFSQATYIKGRVLNDENGEPLAGVSVYFNNTSSGSTTSPTGEFSVSLPDVPNAELIVSSIGFEVLVYKIKKSDNTALRYVFRLKAKEQLMQDVLILPDALRRKYLKIFTDNFLGLTQEAASSTIKNIDAVYFSRVPGDRQNIYANSDTPLVIVNKLLGYRIHFQLQQFYFNENDGSTAFYGFTRYEEMGDKKRWIKRRRKAYYGSTLHFFRSLIKNQLAEESYKIFLVRTDTLKKADGSIEKMDIGIPATVEQILRRDNSSEEEQYRATWKNKLMVQYGKDPASKAYLRQTTFLNGSLPVGFRSYITLTEDVLGIDKNGILLNPMSIMMSGYWIYEKAANLLPYDYDPKKE